MFSGVRLCISALLCALVVTSPFAVVMCEGRNSSTPQVLTFGYFRVTGVDSPHTLSAYLASIHKANVEQLLPGFTFALDVTTIDCPSDGCEGVLGLHQSRVKIAGFIAKMPTFMAILRPCHLVAPELIDAAIAAGDLPILDPITVRTADHDRTNLVLFNDNIRFEITRLFTYMQHEAGCAISGILYGPFSELESHIGFATSLFTTGGLRAPAALNIVDASEQEIRDFIIHKNEGRRCYLVLAMNRVYRRAMDALATDAEFVPKNSRMYGISLMGGDSFLTAATGSVAPYVYTSFVRWFPTLNATTTAMAQEVPSVLRDWEMSRTADELALFTTYGLSTDGTTSHFSLQGMLVMTYLLQTVRSASSRFPHLAGENISATQWWTPIVDVVFSESMDVGGYPFNRAVRTCPPRPLEQICFCNLVTSTSYMYKVDAVRADGSTDVVWDDAAAGQRDIASVAATCADKTTGWSYPITGLSIEPMEFIPRIGMTTAQVTALNTLTNKVYGSSIRDINYADVAPARPYRYALLPAPGNGMVGADELLASYVAQYNPFVILGSMAGSVWHPTILTLFPSLIEIEMEDPVLVPHDQWTWQLINIRPVLADLIHAAISYYAQEPTFTSAHAITSTARGAELISMSFATFGYDFPPSMVVVTADPEQWHSVVHAWLNNPSSAKPFVLAATTSNPGNCIDYAFRAASESLRGTLAMCLFEGLFYNAFTKNGLRPSNTSDIVIATYLMEWWMGSTEGVPTDLVPFVKHPRYHIVASAVAFMKRLGDSVQYNFIQTAAEVLYSVQTVSNGFGTYGPFSNNTCSDDIIATNNPDRNCQCTKGVRDIYVQSVQNWISGEYSHRTNRYKYTLSACGVIYKPYVPPVVPFTLSDGAIAGIAVGCAAFVIGLLVTGVLLNYYCIGRNNRIAPKDSTRPFTIVFTDIQASTALWSRAPLVMSDAISNHHRLVRQCIRRANGYEVKTVGDSFMVAFQDVEDAVRFSLDVQITLNRSSWSDEIDANYIEILAEAGIFEKDDDDPTATGEGRAIAKDLTDEASKNNASATMPGGGHEMVSLQSLPTCSNSQNVTFTQQQQQHQSSLVPIGTVGAPSTYCPSSYADTPMGTSTAYRNGHRAARIWHGLRVRIGVSHGMGDIRKDPTSQGYDYYGTVVNTGARVEGVGHGGQVLLTGDAYAALSPSFIKGLMATIIALGPQPLRGLDSPIPLYQFVPTSLEGRRFPPLRLHIEKETEEDVLTDTATESTEVETPEAMIRRLCASKQYAMVPADSLLMQYAFFQLLVGSSPEANKITFMSKLGESWGFEAAAKAARHEGPRSRLVVGLLAKVLKAFLASGGNGNARRRSLTSNSRHGSQNKSKATNDNDGSHCGHVSIVAALRMTSSDSHHHLQQPAGNSRSRPNISGALGSASASAVSQLSAVPGLARSAVNGDNGGPLGQEGGSIAVYSATNNEFSSQSMIGGGGGTSATAAAFLHPAQVDI